MMGIPNIVEGNKNLINALEEIEKVVAEDKKDWDSLKYYSKIMYCGSQIGYTASLLVPMFAMTKNVENIDFDTLKAFYESVEATSALTVRMFKVISDHILLLNPDTEDETESKQEYIS